MVREQAVLLGIDPDVKSNERYKKCEWRYRTSRVAEKGFCCRCFYCFVSEDVKKKKKEGKKRKWRWWLFCSERKKIKKGRCTCAQPNDPSISAFSLSDLFSSVPSSIPQFTSLFHSPSQAPLASPFAHPLFPNALHTMSDEYDFLFKGMSTAPTAYANSPGSTLLSPTRPKLTACTLN